EREIAVVRDDRVMHGDELRTVGERALDLHFGDHFGHAVHHLVAAEDRAADVHELGDRAAVADQLEQLRREQRDGFGGIEAEAAREALLRDEPGLVEEELIEIAWCEPHAAFVASSPPARPRCLAQGRARGREELADHRGHTLATFAGDPKYCAVAKWARRDDR